MVHKLLFCLLTGILCSLSLTSCEDDSEDRLQAENILGTYILSSRSFDNISDLSVPCCDTLDLIADADPHDLRGVMRAYGTGYDNSGAFTIKPSEGLMEFEYGSTRRIMPYEQADDQLYLTYEEANQTIQEGWMRISQ